MSRCANYVDNKIVMKFNQLFAVAFHFQSNCWMNWKMHILSTLQHAWYSALQTQFMCTTLLHCLFTFSSRSFRVISVCRRYMWIKIIGIFARSHPSHWCIHIMQRIGFDFISHSYRFIAKWIICKMQIEMAEKGKSERARKRKKHLRLGWVKNVGSLKWLCVPKQIPIPSFQSDNFRNLLAARNCMLPTLTVGEKKGAKKNMKYMDEHRNQMMSLWHLNKLLVFRWMYARAYAAGPIYMHINCLDTLERK